MEGGDFFVRISNNFKMQQSLKVFDCRPRIDFEIQLEVGSTKSKHLKILFQQKVEIFLGQMFLHKVDRFFSRSNVLGPLNVQKVSI